MSMRRNPRSDRGISRMSVMATFLCAGLVCSVAWTQVPPVPDTVNDTVKPLQDPPKETTKDAQDAVKDATKDGQENVPYPAKKAGDTARDTARDAQETVRDANRDARETVRDARETVRDARDTARDTTRDARETARDTVRDVRETARDAANDLQETARDAARDATRAARDAGQDLQENTRRALGIGANANGRAGLRGGDVGIWFDTSVTDGLVIADVESNSALSAAGFREGDRIVSIQGKRVMREPDFMHFVLDETIRIDRIPVVVMRDGQEQTLYLEPAIIRERIQAAGGPDPTERFGIAFDDRYPDKLVVWKVFPRSPAFYAGIRSGDVLTNFSGRPLKNANEFGQVLATSQPGMVQLQVERNSRMRQINVELPNFQMGPETRTALRPNLDAELDARPGAMYDNAQPRANRRPLRPWRARRG